MLNVTNAKTTISAVVKQTAIGNVDYTVNVVETVGVQVVHTVRSEVLNRSYQWVTETLDLVNYEEDVRAKLAEAFPAPEVSEEAPQQIAW